MSIVSAFLVPGNPLPQLHRRIAPLGPDPNRAAWPGEP